MKYCGVVSPPGLEKMKRPLPSGLPCSISPLITLYDETEKNNNFVRYKKITRIQGKTLTA